MADTLTIHFINDCDNFRKGTYYRLHNLAIALTKLGQKVTVFTTDTRPGIRDREELRDGVLYRIISVSSYGIPHKIGALRQCFVDYPACDVAHLFQPLLSQALAWWFNQSRKAKVLFYDWDDLLVSDSDPFSFIGSNVSFQSTLLTRLKSRESLVNSVRSLVIYQLQNILPSKADHVTTCSHFLKNLAYSKEARKVTVLYNGTWPFSTPDKQQAREKLGLDKDGLYFGLMGNSYGLDSWCLQALKENCQQDPRLRLALCGPYYTKEGLSEMDEEIQHRVDILGLLSPEAARDFAAAIDVGLLPLNDSLFHQSRFPMKFAEYLGSGTPILCSSVGECIQLGNDLPFVFKAGKTCKEFVAASSKVVDLMKTNSLPEVGQNKVQQLFSWNSITKELLNSYYKELNSKEVSR